ncbi:chondroitin sulfate synthase 1-like [Glandiceps talaboti]
MKPYFVPFVGGLFIGILISGTLILFGPPRSRRKQPSALIHRSEEVASASKWTNNRNLKNDVSTDHDPIQRGDRNGKHVTFQISEGRQYETVPRFAYDELSLRKLMYTAVIVDYSQLTTWGQAIKDTWAQHLEDYHMFISTAGKIPEGTDLPLIKLPDINGGADENITKLVMTLKDICYRCIDVYSWFVILPTCKVYVNYIAMEAFLKTLNNSQVLYMGSRHSKESYCTGSPGIILSRKTLQQICPYLDSCLQQGNNSVGDRELGRCILKYAGVNCTKAKQFQGLFYTLKESDGDLGDDLSKKLFLKEVLSISPVKDVNDLKHVHLYYSILRLKQLQQQSEKYITKIENMDKLLDTFSSSHVSLSSMKDEELYGSCNKGPEVNTIWEYLGSDVNLTSDNPLFSHTSDFELHDILNEAQKSLPGLAKYNTGVDIYRKRSYRCQSFVYKVVIRNVNFQYVVDIDHHLGNVVAMSSKTVPDVKMNFVVSLSENDVNFQHFMLNLEKCCLKEQARNVSLLVILFRDNSPSNLLRSKDLLSLYQHKYPQAYLRYIYVEDEKYSISWGLELSRNELSPDSFLVILPVDVTFNKEFLDRCKMETKKGQQAYNPIPFQYFTNQNALGDIKDNKNGFWDSRNRDVLCVFHEDLFKVLNSAEKSVVGIENFFKSSHLKVLRAPDQDVFRSLNEDCSKLHLSESQLLKCIQNREIVNHMHEHFKVGDTF